MNVEYVWGATEALLQEVLREYLADFEPQDVVSVSFAPTILGSGYVAFVITAEKDD